MRKILTYIINHYSLQQCLIKVYIVITAPIIGLLSFFRVSGINKSENLTKIKNYKNKYQNKRCFIVGNGPSLKVEDLDKLENEYTFAFNWIFLLFSKTKWRPTYYMLADQNVYLSAKDEINSKDLEIKLIGANCIKYGKYIKDAIYFYTRPSIYRPGPKFSDNALKYFYDGYTVTYFALQMAVYMGFKEIYLLGIDCSYVNEIYDDGTIKDTGSKKNYFSSNYVKDNRFRNTTKMIKAYKAAQQYTKKYGIKIYNATRGGKLEEFERIDFDTIEFD